jgi:hypothetical protein
MATRVVAYTDNILFLCNIPLDLQI